MTGRHHKRTTRALNIGVASVATATATALTVAAAPAPEQQTARDALVELTAAIDYTQLITDSSNTLNNLLFIQGNVEGAAASLWNPLAGQAGGLLPTFFAGTEQDDLTSLDGLLAVLEQITELDLSGLSGVPGVPADAATTILTTLLPGLAPALLGLTPLLATTEGALALVSGVIAALNGISDLAEGLGLPPIGGIPDIDDLLPGLTVTETTYESGYQWPILGLDGSTTVSNTFAQLDSLNLTALVDGLVDGLEVPESRLVARLVATALRPLAVLDGVTTPSVTAWIPAGSGNYGLPLGGEIGWLATMPTLALGPVSLLGVDIPETVVAIPIGAAGVVLPLNLASFGLVSTPGVVFPTATGVSTLGGTTLQNFAIPLLGINVLSVNALNSTYVGTNGFNYNSGTTITTITTPFGALPLIYSLGSVNAGTTGFGVTLPSLFTVGLLPSFQVGTAPTQQSPDGLLPPSLLNLGVTTIPTQLTDVVTLLGLPDPGAPLEALLTPLFNATLAPLGAQLTALLDENAGPAVNDLASFIEQLTGLLAEATYGLPGANSPEPTTTTLALRTDAAAVDVPEVTSTPSDDTQMLDVTVDSTPNPSDAEPVIAEESGESEEAQQAEESNDSDEPGQRPLRNTSLAATLSDARDNLRTAVNDTRDQLRQATERVAGSIRDAVGNNRGDDESAADDDNTSQVNNNDNGGDNNNGGSGDGD